MDAYIRVSRVGKRRKEGESFQSPAKQRDEIETWAKLRGVEIGKWHAPELDVSGKKASRPILNEAMARIEAGESDGIVVAKLTRFGRSVPDGLKLVKRIHDAGGKFAAIDLGIDPMTSTGKLVFTFFLALAEWEHERQTEEWAGVRDRAHDDGAYLAPAPTGYTKTKRSKLKRDPKTWRIVREAFRLRGKGATLAAVADYLRENGVMMSRSGVRVLIHNRAYLGEAMGRPDSHEAIVTQEEWDAAQMPHGGGRPIHDGSIAAQGMLTRIIRCDGCGQRISVGGSRERRDGTKPGRYFCRGYSTSGRCPSPAAGMVALVDDYVREAITTAMVDGTLKATADAIRRYNRAADAVTKAQADLNAIKTNTGLIASLGVDGVAEMAASQKAVLDAARATLAETPRPDSILEPDSLLWDKWDIEDERAFARQVISEVRLRTGGKGRYSKPMHERIEIRWAGHDDFDTTVHARGAEARETAARLRAVD